ncbi:DUF2550 family protein [Rudaeicoccus suwonensis]|uniref:Uncharacterized protein DUF2550 n=1 Tax=Rudaeicoccus suwonensis TaxID=657409 RepID=A0A561DX80_9MICO|nr:DUF2550 family protein [Rudaeicoccus suwonensis]TWE07967.1 uncharacterized protein DUF2550 [Rudaeicoccus suwonensis]
MIATLDGLGVVLACLALLVLAAMIALIVRRRLISRGEPMLLLAVSRSDGWHLGMARLTTASVQWHSIIGVGVRPREVWRRGDLDLGAPSPLEGTRPLAIIDPVQVQCSVDGGSITICLASGDYTALRSWSESAPPGLNANVA